MHTLTTLRHWVRVAPFVALLGLAGCEIIQFSPNDHRVPEKYTNLTQKNLAKLQAQPLAPGDTLRFVFTGDSQNFYYEADKLVESVNQQPGIAFTLVAGDISDYGLAREMSWVAEKLQGLKKPFITVVGNHDLVGNGRTTYEHIYGPLNYSFVYGDTKFILVDTNGREYNFNGQVPDMNWVRPQLANLDGARRQVVVSHVSPTSGDFDPTLVGPYTGALRDAQGLVFEMNGHTHSSSIGQPYEDGVTYVNSDAFSERRYFVVTVWGNKEFRIKQVKF